jgi:hypothetical protein
VSARLLRPKQITLQATMEVELLYLGPVVMFAHVLTDGDRRIAVT